MAVIVSLLRGVNVGGNHLIRMDALRALCAPLGFQHSLTCLQSGNLIFKTAERSLARIETLLQDAIESDFGFRPRVIARTAADIRAVIANNPFGAQAAAHPSRLLVIFLAGVPDRAAAQKLQAISVAPDEFHLAGRELYAYFPNGIGRSKLSPTLIEKTLDTQGTGRNWNTVAKLLAMAEQLESR